MTEAEFTTWPFAPGTALPPLVGQGATLRQVQVPAGYVAARHSHAHEQFLLVTSGAGLLQCAAGEVALSPGTVIRLAPEAWHSATFTAPTVLIEVNLADPAEPVLSREDRAAALEA
jgi:quercetin dioxygenase-like cupin family protein